jgi:hypothetical protein
MYYTAAIAYFGFLAACIFVKANTTSKIVALGIYTLVWMFLLFGYDW